MSTWLVDTHALLWFLEDSTRLSATAKETMESGRSTLLVSAASLWEVAIKANLGKLHAPDDLPTIIRDQGFQELPITGEHAWAVRDLPLSSHKDPFDRFLVAQARVERLPVISSDALLDEYDITRHW